MRVLPGKRGMLAVKVRDVAAGVPWVWGFGVHHSVLLTIFFSSFRIWGVRFGMWGISSIICRGFHRENVGVGELHARVVEEAHGLHRRDLGRHLCGVWDLRFISD